MRGDRGFHQEILSSPRFLYSLVYHTNHQPKQPWLNKTMWEDLRIVPGAFQFAGAADPDLSNWQPGGAGATFKVYAFKVNDLVYFTCQLPHSYKEGTELKPHLHWTPRDRGVAEDTKTVGWLLSYSAISPEGVFLASSDVDLTDTCSGVDHAHLQTDSGTIPGTGLKVSAMLVCLLKNAGTGTWVGNAAGTAPAILEFDIHFEVNTMGSREELVK